MSRMHPFSRPRPFFRIPVFLILFISLLLFTACNAPSPAQTPGGIAGGPNLTLTALFSSVGQPDQTETPAVILPPTNTDIPTSPPSATFEPLSQPTQEATQEATQSPTQAPTLAPTAAPTAAARSGPSAKAVFLAVPPIINGSLTDLGGDIYLINSVVYGGSNHSGEADASGRFLVSWDAQYLYVGVEVRDDIYAQNATGAQIYKGDCIELLLDVSLANDFQSTELNEDDYQLGLAPGRGQAGQNLENWLWYPRGKSGAVSGIVMASQRIENGYILEAAIPWTVFGITPSAGQRYGFSVAVSDNDDTANAVQQSMAAFAPNRQLTNPTSWVNLELVMP